VTEKIERMKEIGSERNREEETKDR
jgi:hypothetical protein